MKNNSVIFFTNDREKNNSLIEMLKGHSNLTVCSYSSDSWVDVDFFSSKNVCFVLDDIPQDQNVIWIISKLADDGVFYEVPILFTSFKAMRDFEKMGFQSFAYDIFPEVFNYEIARRRFENISDIRQLKLQISNLTQIHTKRILNQANKLKEQTVRMQTMNFELVELLVAAIESRDLESGKHIKRIKHFTKALTGAVMEKCPEYGITEQQAEYICFASSVHDIGKIAIPDAIMLKPGRLTPDEFEVMKTHTTRGAKLLDMLDGISETDMYFKYCQDICHYHHERWNGKGYPAGLKEDEIPISAQIVSVADCYDALTSHRPYKRALTHEEAVEMILNGACGAFSPKMLECFTCVIPEFARIENELKSVEIQYDENYEVAYEYAPYNASDYESKTEEPEKIALTEITVQSGSGIKAEFEKPKLFDAYDLIFEANIEKDYFTVLSGQWKKFFNYIPKNFSEFIAQCHKVCHPADASRFAAKVSMESFETLVKLGRTKTRVEFRIIKDDIEFLAVGVIVFTVDDEGYITHLNGAFNMYEDDDIMRDIKSGIGVTDSLTGLMLPKQFEVDVDSYIKENPSHKNLMIHVDIDDMSLCNNLFGYEYGNALIKEFGVKLRDVKGKDKIVCKSASDKFLVFIKNIASHAEMVMLIENLHNLLKKPYHTANSNGVFTATLGIARYPNDGKNYKKLQVASEYASQAAKVNGKNSYAFYNNGMSQVVNFSAEYDEIQSCAAPKNNNEPKFIPCIDSQTGKLVCYDYVPFSVVEDNIPVTLEVFYDLNKDSPTRKNMGILAIKSLLYMLVGLKKKGDKIPPMSVFTSMIPDDIPSVLQELKSFVEENDCSGIDLCIMIPQDFLLDISIRKLSSFAQLIKEMGFTLGLYLVCSKYIHNNCYLPDIFSRYIVASDYVEKTISNGATQAHLEYAAMTLNNLKVFADIVSIPGKLTESNVQMMKSAGAEGFSYSEESFYGVNRLMENYSFRQKISDKHVAPKNPVQDIDPTLLYHDMNRGGKLYITYYAKDRHVAMSCNAKDVLGFDIVSTMKTSPGFENTKFVHPDDASSAMEAFTKARLEDGVVDFNMRLAANPEASAYNSFKCTVLCIRDDNGAPMRFQCSLKRA